jgi:hypothetical protein
MNKFLIILTIISGVLSAQVNLTSGLKVCMTYSGNAKDLSGNNNNGTVSGAVTLTTDRNGAANSAYHFTGGLTDFISIANFANVTTNNEISVSLWAQSEQVTSTCLFGLNPDNDNDRCLGCAQYSGVGLIWDYGSIYTNGRVTTAQSPDNLWHHYVFITSQSQNIKQIYLDGVAVSNTTYMGSLVNRNLPMYIGAGTSASGGGSLRWRGKIDDVFMYNRSLNAAEVTALFGGAVPCTATVNTSGISETSNGPKRWFYPSPSPGSFIYSGDVQLLNSIEVFATDGRQISISTGENINGQTVLDLRNAENGIYFIKLKSENGTELHKVVVDH